MSQFINYKKKGPRFARPMPARRFFKLLLKTAQRGSDVGGCNRDLIVKDALAPFGLSATWSQLNETLQIKEKDCQAWRNGQKVKGHLIRGRTFIRIGKAALKKNTTVNILALAKAGKQAQNLRLVPFYNPSAGNKFVKQVPNL